jgi:hypothetical protein
MDLNMKQQVILIAAIMSIFIIGCSDNGKAIEENMDASVNGGCPAVQPTFPDLFCSGNVACGYGFECCCGACSTVTTCHCINGMYKCTDTGMCDNPWCEDGGVDGGGVDGG